MKGIKHLIECHCTLPQYRNSKKILYHKFIVFSIIDNSDTVISKFAQCNNCDVVHRVYDICKSEILAGRDEFNSLLTKDELKLMLPDDVVGVLESYNVDLATYEKAKFILDNNMWKDHVILAKDSLDDETTGKMLVFESKKKFKIELFSFKTSIDPGEK
ncbi:hypothetical protein CL614_04500 [archaeon]|nr:hypothetical protein [archaeon]